MREEDVQLQLALAADRDEAADAGAVIPRSVRFPIASMLMVLPASGTALSATR